jgi:hypothetical protein
VKVTEPEESVRVVVPVSVAISSLYASDTEIVVVLSIAITLESLWLSSVTVSAGIVSFTVISLGGDDEVSVATARIAALRTMDRATAFKFTASAAVDGKMVQLTIRVAAVAVL